MRISNSCYIKSRTNSLKNAVIVITSMAIILLIKPEPTTSSCLVEKNANSGCLSRSDNSVPKIPILYINEKYTDFFRVNEILCLTVRIKWAKYSLVHSFFCIREISKLHGKCYYIHLVVYFVPHGANNFSLKIMLHFVYSWLFIFLSMYQNMGKELAFSNMASFTQSGSRNFKAPKNWDDEKVHRIF